MNLKFKVQSSKFKVILLFAVCIYFTACSIPNLQPQECNEARQTVRELYSYHFGSDMKFTPETLKQREKYLTPELFNNLNSAPQNVDPFTLTNDYPKAFRAGGCTVVEPGNKVSFEILLFWKSENRSEQREVNAEVVKQGDNWLVNKISNN
ncbi:MAG: hypothetical protein ACR2L1_05415 [Pyrinomonadaceae bacterium]